jgi:hypothetical protein
LIFAGVDWAEAHHDVFFADEQGRRLGGGRLAEGIAGIAAFHELAARHAGEPGEVVVGTGTGRGLFAAALIAAGYQVFAVNPLSVWRYRDRHGVSGAKSDPGDAKVLADLVRTDRHNHRPAAGDSDLAEAVRVLARAHAPDRYPTAKSRRNYAGTSPVTRASGTRRVVLARHARNKRLADAIYLWAFPALSASPGARTYYDQHRAAGDTHHQALRALGNRLVGILHGCLAHSSHYDETTAWAHRQPTELTTAA